MNTFGRRISSTQARQELFCLIQSVLEGNDPVQILHRGQPAAVLIGNTEYRRLQAHVKNPSTLRRGLKGCIKVGSTYTAPSLPRPTTADEATTSATIVTDTEPFLWYVSKLHGLLPPAVLAIFEDAVAGRRTVILPMTVLYDLCVLEETGGIKFHVPMRELLQQGFFARSIELEQLDPIDIMFASLPVLPGDFSDKIAIATAIRNRCPLITADLTIHRAAVCQLFWQ